MAQEQATGVSIAGQQLVNRQSDVGCPIDGGYRWRGFDRQIPQLPLASTQNDEASSVGDPHSTFGGGQRFQAPLATAPRSDVADATDHFSFFSDSWSPQLQSTTPQSSPQPQFSTAPQPGPQLQFSTAPQPSPNRMQTSSVQRTPSPLSQLTRASLTATTPEKPKVNVRLEEFLEPFSWESGFGQEGFLEPAKVPKPLWAQRSDCCGSFLSPDEPMSVYVSSNLFSGQDLYDVAPAEIANFSYENSAAAESFFYQMYQESSWCNMQPMF